VLGPDGVGGDEFGAIVGALALDVAVEDVGDSDIFAARCGEDFCEGAAYGSEAEQSYVQDAVRQDQYSTFIGLSIQAAKASQAASGQRLVMGRARSLKGFFISA